MTLAVLGVNHAFSPATTEELVYTTVAILKMWQFSVLVLVPLVPTAALHLVSLGIAIHTDLLAWFPGLLTPAFVACSTNVLVLQATNAGVHEKAWE